MPKRSRRKRARRIRSQRFWDHNSWMADKDMGRTSMSWRGYAKWRRRNR